MSKRRILFALCVVSIAAIMAPLVPKEGGDFDENDWSDPERPKLNAYTKSKTLAEMALWEWQKTEAPDAQVTAINPSFDVTPAALVDVLVTERAVVERPDGERIAAMMR